MDLIDRNALKERLPDLCGGIAEMLCKAVREIVDSAPTIAQPPNDPLIPEELREMDGEPVWVRELVGPQTGNWALVTVTRACGVRLLALNTNYPEDSCGVTWRAYRHKPEEGVQND